MASPHHHRKDEGETTTTISNCNRPKSYRSNMLVINQVPFDSNNQAAHESNTRCDKIMGFIISFNGSKCQTQDTATRRAKQKTQRRHRDRTIRVMRSTSVARRDPATLTECYHHRTKTKQVRNNRRRHLTLATDVNSHVNTSRTRIPSCSASTIRWALVQLALIYIILTSDSLKIAQATKTATNYWPLIHQNRYQQLFFTGRMQSQLQQDDHNDDPSVSAVTIASLPSEHHQHNPQRRLLNPLRHHTQQQSAAIAAAAAAMAATANAVLARKSQTHNLMIGQNFNNFSSIIPYSIMQDVDYGTMQEDQIINEPMNDMQANNIDELQQHQLHAINNDELRSSDSNSESAHSVPAPLSKGPIMNTKSSAQIKVIASDRALLPLDSNRLMLPQMQQIKARFNQGCVGGTKCQFFAFCWMSGGSLGASCGLLMTCCVTPSRQEIQPGFYGPVVNDPYCGRSTSKINRIVGGTDASFGQFPWQAFVQVGGSRCGGALISSRHVVTAGHCVARSQHSPSSIKVTLGDYILNSDIESIPHEVYSVVEVLLHPNFRFTPQADRYDVAVLELDRAASYKDNIKPICLPQKDATFVGRVAYVAGWGALQAGSKLRPKVLQHVAVPVIENHVCESWHRRKGIDIRIYDEMMCAGYELGQRDACQGDSGGPLMLNQFGVWYLVGIVSAGYSCAKQYQPGIYHRVSSSSDWISSNVYQQGNSK